VGWPQIIALGPRWFASDCKRRLSEHARQNCGLACADLPQSLALSITPMAVSRRSYTHRAVGVSGVLRALVGAGADVNLPNPEGNHAHDDCSRQQQ
jgi:hypothetical protein